LHTPHIAVLLDPCLNMAIATAWVARLRASCQNWRTVAAADRTVYSFMDVPIYVYIHVNVHHVAQRQHLPSILIAVSYATTHSPFRGLSSEMHASNALCSCSTSVFCVRSVPTRCRSHAVWCLRNSVLVYIVSIPYIVEIYQDLLSIADSPCEAGDITIGFDNLWRKLDTEPITY